MYTILLLYAVLVRVKNKHLVLASVSICIKPTLHTSQISLPAFCSILWLMVKYWVMPVTLCCCSQIEQHDVGW